MGTNIETELNLNLLPATANLEPITIEGQSTVDFLTFRYSGMILGGLARRISMISSGSLPTRIKAYYDLPIRWKITWLGSKHEFVPVAGHTIFVTMNRPLEPEEVTYKRMAKAVEIVQQLNTLEPYEIVKGIFQNWNNYTLATYRDNPWELADLPGGADCITIVRYALAILKMVGCPGEAEALVIWANPLEDPNKAIEQNAKERPLGLHGIGSHPEHSDWSPGLLDGSWHSNMFEAALKFEHAGKTKYFGGGAGIYDTAQKVLEIFRCLAWIKGTGGLNCQIMEVAASYRGGCVVGDEHTCFV
jgi:hypothetical protein